jgi:hypothetical protein
MARPRTGKLTEMTCVGRRASNASLPRCDDPMGFPCGRGPGSGLVRLRLSAEQQLGRTV